MQSFKNVGNIYFKAILPYNSQTKLTNQSIDPEFHPKICIIRTPGRDSRSPAKVRPTDDEFQRGGINSVTTRKDLLFSLWRIVPLGFSYISTNIIITPHPLRSS